MELEVPAVLKASIRGGVDDDHGLFPCPNCDIQMVHKLAQLLLSGLATACVDSTTFSFFSSFASAARDSSSSAVAAVEMRKELVDYITHRSTSIILDNKDDEIMSMDPSETVSIFLDDFASTKRHILVGWLGLGLMPYLSDSRDDKIDDLVQEMETTRFWPIHAREAVARSLLMAGNLDVSGRFHCRDKLERKGAADGHVDCSFRPVRCQNQGCRAEVSALRAREHDEVCPLKLLPCEQHCGLSVTRSQMDRHCITTCPMKLTNCPFYQLGCESAFPSCNLESHCAQFLQSHLRKLLLNHIPVTDRDDHLDLVEKRLLLLEKCDSHATLLKALDVRSLTKALAEVERNMNAQP